MISCSTEETEPLNIPEKKLRAPVFGREAARERIYGELIDLCYQRAKEGLSSFVVKVFKNKGELLYSKPLPDFTERREYADLILTLAEHKPKAVDPDQLGGVTLVIQGGDITTAYGLPPLFRQPLRALSASSTEEDGAPGAEPNLGSFSVSE